MPFEISVTRKILRSRITRIGLPRKDPLAYNQAMQYLAAITMLILTLAIMPPVNAQSFKPDYKAGSDAYHGISNGFKRDFVTALKHMRPLAKQGHAKAQHLLGIMYENGQGLLHDPVMAYVWFHIAATNGGPGRASRDSVRKELTASDLKLARKLSKLCLKNPAKCPEYSDD
jgi:TPR repeat protein